MGLWDWVGDIVENIVDNITIGAMEAIDSIKDIFSSKTYDESDVAAQVDVDAELAKFRENTKDGVAEAEKQCMSDISSLFSDLINRTQEKFPDLVEIIRAEQEKAERELKGTIMKYLKEHLSKNDPQFLEVLKMNPGSAKREALDIAFNQNIENAKKVFSSKLKKYIEYILREFTRRLTDRIVDQEERMSQRMNELEILQMEAEKGQIDVDALRDSSAPVMESAQCIIKMLEMEV